MASRVKRARSRPYRKSRGAARARRAYDRNGHGLSGEARAVLERGMTGRAFGMIVDVAAVALLAAHYGKRLASMAAQATRTLRTRRPRPRAYAAQRIS